MFAYSVHELTRVHVFFRDSIATTPRATGPITPGAPSKIRHTHFPTSPMRDMDPLLGATPGAPSKHRQAHSPVSPVREIDPLLGAKMPEDLLENFARKRKIATDRKNAIAARKAQREAAFAPA